MSRRTSSSGTVRHQMFRFDGAVRWVNCAVSIIDWDAGLTIQASLVDITDRKLAEQELRVSNERFHLLADNVKEAFVIVEVPGGRALYLSRMWKRWDDRSRTHTRIPNSGFERSTRMIRRWS